MSRPAQPTPPGSVLDRALAWVAVGSMAFGCLAMLAMMVHVALDVAGRFSGGWRVQGTLETVTYVYMAAAVFLPLAMVQIERRQITVDVFIQLLPRRLSGLLQGLTALGGAAFMLAFTWYGGQEALKQTLILEAAPSTTSPVPIWPSRWMVVLAGAPMAVSLLLQALGQFRVALGGREPAVIDIGTLIGLAPTKPSAENPQQVN